MYKVVQVDKTLLSMIFKGFAFFIIVRVYIRNIEGGADASEYKKLYTVANWSWL